MEKEKLLRNDPTAVSLSVMEKHRGLSKEVRGGFMEEVGLN